MIIDTDKYIDAGEAARILGIKRARMSQLCTANRFPGQVRIGHFWIMPLESVIEFERNTPGVKPKEKTKKETLSSLSSILKTFNGADEEGKREILSRLIKSL